MKALRSWRALLVTTAVAAGLLTVLVVAPVSGADHENAVRLHLGTDYQSFSDGTTAQPVTLGSQGCALSADSIAGPLVSLSTNNGRSPGFFDLSLGVKSGGSNGTPCSQIDDRETLTIANVVGQPNWVGLRLDLELKGNAWVVIDLLHGANPVGTFELVSGSSIGDYNAANGTSLTPTTSFPYTATSTATEPVAACANPSDSGPDSGPNDNCLWSIAPAGGFDTIVVTAQVGSVSVEGSEDFNNDPGHDTLFFRNEAPSALDDAYEFIENSGANTIDAPGVLANDTDPDGDVLTAGIETDPTNGSLTLNTDGSFTYTPDTDYFGPDLFTYRADDGSDVSAPATVNITVVEAICPGETVSATDPPVSGAFTHIGDQQSPCKPYEVTANASSGVVDFLLGDGVTVPFRGFLEFEPQAAPGGVNTQTLQYDPEGDGTYKTVQVCLGPIFDTNGNVLVPTAGTILPAGETWCLASMNSVADDNGLFVNRYQVYGESDPRFRVG